MESKFEVLGKCNLCDWQKESHTVEQVEWALMNHMIESHGYTAEQFEKLKIRKRNNDEQIVEE